MRWKNNRKKRSLDQWHGWFAWYPVQAFDEYGRKWTVWLERVIRRWTNPSRLAGAGRYLVYLNDHTCNGCGMPAGIEHQPGCPRAPG